VKLGKNASGTCTRPIGRSSKSSVSEWHRTVQGGSHVRITSEGNIDSNSVVHFEFIPQGQRVKETYYMEMLKRLPEAVLRKRPQLWPSD
jgi:hypothetical protein